MSLPALNLVAEPLPDAFHRDGYLVLRDVVDLQAIDSLVERLVWLASRRTGLSWSSLFSVSLARHLATHSDARADIVAQSLVPAWLPRFMMQRGILDAAEATLGTDVQLLRRIDLDLTPPLEAELLRPWHQDHFYVRGSKRTIAMHVPLQDTTFREGCLQVMPGSHRIGPVAHDRLVLGQRHCPSAIEEREVRMIPLYRGDIVILHSLMLRQDGLNLSPALRAGVTARFIPRGARWSPAMGGTIEAL